MNWKVPGWAAAAGAVISVVAALAGGNPFGTILLRAVISALVAAGLGLGAQYVVRRFLPGLAAAPAPPQPSVDILLDEEVPLAAQAGGGQAEEDLAAAVEGLGEEAGGALDDSVGGPDQVFPLEEGEGLPSPAVPTGRSERRAVEPAAELASEPFPELAEMEGLTEPEPASARSPTGRSERSPAEETPEVEELPSGGLEALSAMEPDDALAAGASEPAVPSRRALKAEELEAQLDSVTKGQDPASLAKAVRTFLRKDQEG